jgi:tyrosinase
MVAPAWAQLSVPPLSTGTYTVSWTEPSGGQTRAYLFESANLGPWIRSTVTGSNSRTFTKSPGTYSYRLQICFFEPELNRELCDPFSNEATVVVASAQGVPGVPGSLGGNFTSTTGTFTLSWAAAAGTVTRYELEERTGNGPWNRIQDDSAQSASLTRADGHYDYRGRACNNAGCGGYTANVSVTVLRIPGTPGSLGPDIVATVLAYSISWGAASGTVQRYELHERQGQGAWAVVHDGSARNRTFTNQPVGVYEYRARACNGSGCGSFTGIKRVTVELEDNIRGPVVSSGCYRLEWDQTGDEVQLQEKRPGGSWATILKSRTRTGIELCQCVDGNYQYRLRACIPPEPGFPGFCPPWGQIHSVAVDYGGQVRRNIAGFDPAGPEIAALRQGIQVMQSRSASDPTSWIYQANIHGTPASDFPLRTAWNSCQHGSWFFLSWHRMYLHFFERILRHASGDPNFGLPYWNYSNLGDPNARQLPLPFRLPNDSSNVLFIPQRSPALNAGGQLPESAVSFADAFALRNFSSTVNSGQSFGGQRLNSPAHAAGPHSIFETTPHDAVHVTIGGLMGTFERSARDPIFWLHHANVDRLWERWLRQGGGRANPTEPVWLTQTFEFFDETGQRVTLSGQEIVDTVRNLNYCYDDQVSTRRLLGAEAAQTAAPSLATAEPRQGAARPMMALAADSAVELTGRPVTVTLTPQDTGQTDEEALTVEGQERFVLNLEGIAIDAVPEGYYEIYLNLPAGMPPEHRSPFYVGNLALFGLGRHVVSGQTGAPEHEAANQTFDITHVVRQLQAIDAWDERPVAVTLVPRAAIPPPGMAPDEALATPVRIQRLTITRE